LNASVKGSILRGIVELHGELADSGFSHSDEFWAKQAAEVVTIAILEFKHDLRKLEG
jgi:hypothetical protein